MLSALVFWCLSPSPFSISPAVPCSLPALRSHVHERTVPPPPSPSLSRIYPLFRNGQLLSSFQLWSDALAVSQDCTNTAVALKNEGHQLTHVPVIENRANFSSLDTALVPPTLPPLLLFFPLVRKCGFNKKAAKLNQPALTPSRILHFCNPWKVCTSKKRRKKKKVRQRNT